MRLLWKGKKSMYYTYLKVLFFGLFCTLTVEEEETGVLLLHIIHAEGCIQKRAAVKLHLPHVMEKDPLNGRLLWEAAIYQP